MGPACASLYLDTQGSHLLTASAKLCRACKACRPAGMVQAGFHHSCNGNSPPQPLLKQLHSGACFLQAVARRKPSRLDATSQQESRPLTTQGVRVSHLHHSSTALHLPPALAHHWLVMHPQVARCCAHGCGGQLTTPWPRCCSPSGAATR